jgi:hypothetical protein
MKTKLYELIELGSALTEEVHGDYCHCALGTAAAALGLTENLRIGRAVYMALAEHCMPIDFPCPECSCWGPTFNDQGFNFSEMYPEGQPLLWLVDHLHTAHDWPRQKIAEWLKPIEDTFARHQIWRNADSMRQALKLDAIPMEVT